MKKIVITIILVSNILFGLEYGMVGDKIYKVDKTKLFITSNQGSSWESKDFNFYIQDTLVDSNKIILILNNFTFKVSDNLKDFESIKPKLFDNNEFIPDFSKISLVKSKGFYYLTLKESSSSNFNNGQVFKSKDLKNFKKVYSGNLSKYLLATSRSLNNFNLKKVENNYCKDIDGSRECFSNKKIILIKNGEELIIDEVKKNFNLSLNRNRRNLNKHYEGQGFDKCEVANLSQFQTWWNDSPYRTTNLYIGGNSRACANNTITKDYIKQVGNMGWKFISTWVGLQASCSGYGHRISYNNAYNDGVKEANLAISKLKELDLLKNINGNGGGLVYYDLEQFDGRKEACLNSSLEFIKGWSNTLRANNIKSGLYTSGSTLQYMTSISKYIDSLWVAHALLPAQYRTDISINSKYVSNIWIDDKIRQYALDHNENWGGVTLNIDSNVIRSKIFLKQNLIEGVFDGAGSIIKPSVSNDGSNQDIATMHSHKPYNSTIVFQWKDDKTNICSHIDISTKGENIGKVIVTTRPWNQAFPNTQNDDIFEVSLNSQPFSVKKASESTGWTLISITSKKPLDKDNIWVYAKCSTGNFYEKDTQYLLKNDTAKGDNKLISLTRGYWWSGNGSIMSYNFNNKSEYGINQDSGISYKSHNSFTAFQWETTNCKKLKIGIQENWGISNETVNIDEVKIKPWDAKKWDKDRLCNGKLPCIIKSPEISTGHSVSSAGYYIIKIKSQGNVIPTSIYEDNGVNIETPHIKVECIQ